MALPVSTTGLERIYNISLGSTVPASVTTEYVLMRSDRNLQFREIGIIARQTVVSGTPVTNNIRAEFWNITGTATKLAQATITGPTSGTLLERGSFVSIATKSEFIGPGSFASVDRTFAIKFVGVNTLNRGIINPTVRIVADVTI